MSPLFRHPRSSPATVRLWISFCLAQKPSRWWICFNPGSIRIQAFAAAVGNFKGGWWRCFFEVSRVIESEWSKKDAKHQLFFSMNLMVHCYVNSSRCVFEMSSNTRATLQEIRSQIRSQLAGSKKDQGRAEKKPKRMAMARRLWEFWGVYRILYMTYMSFNIIYSIII